MSPVRWHGQNCEHLNWTMEECKKVALVINYCIYLFIFLHRVDGQVHMTYRVEEIAAAQWEKGKRQRQCDALGKGSFQVT